MIGAIDNDLKADTEERDREVKASTGSKSFDVDDVEYEEVGDNGGELFPQDNEPDF
jgi:hypothetical protein